MKRPKLILGYTILTCFCIVVFSLSVHSAMKDGLTLVPAIIAVTIFWSGVIGLALLLTLAIKWITD
jgi:hypothetical protein